jgi:hypothetical protein
MDTSIDIKSLLSKIDSLIETDMNYAVVLGKRASIVRDRGGAFTRFVHENLFA